jgi:RNA polymerase sigma-70 factor (ECF subfamily)
MRQNLARAASLLQSRSPRSIDEGLRLLQSTVFSFSMKLCGHREDAEDTMQDVLLKTVTHAPLPSIEDPRALAVWLYTVARNRCWMSRRRSTFAPKQTLALDDLVPDAAELASLTTDSQHSPEVQVGKEADAEQVREAILRIPPQYRLILVLHDMEELDTAEVAKVTGVREGSVRVRLHRARLFLRRELASASSNVERSSHQRTRGMPPVSCRRMFSLLSEYIDGRINDLTCETFQRHLSDCPPCVAFIQDLERAIERCRSLKVPCESKTADSVRHALVQEYLRVLNSGPKRAKLVGKVL